MKSVLHITAHLGGGVGKILSGVAVHSINYQHKFILLEKPEKETFVKPILLAGGEIIINPSMDELVLEIEKSDIVQIEWWNHPVMSKLLAYFPKIKTRLVIWSHVSGCSYPGIPFEFLKVPSQFIFTSEYSFENLGWTESERSWAKNNVKIINSCGDFKKFRIRGLERHENFNIGYIGTLNYSKLSPKTYEFYGELDDDRYNFIMVGDINEDVKRELEHINQKTLSKIKFKGYAEDVVSELSKFDVFSYLLSDTHFGTTENILLEAMAIGLPVIAFNQCTEKYIIKDKETGFLVSSKEEYLEVIEFLFNHPLERMKIGKSASNFVFENFSLDKTIQKLDETYDYLLKMEKREYSFCEVMGKSPNEWFLNFTGRYKENFKEKKTILKLPYVFRESNKSSIDHFCRYYDEDLKLKDWNKVLKG